MRNNEEIRKIRFEFFKDLNELLELHKRFLQDSEGSDPDGDNWDFVLDACQNIFVDWVLKKRSDE
jgi:hypothetical protein